MKTTETKQETRNNKCSGNGHLVEWQRQAQADSEPAIRDDKYKAYI